MNQGEQMTWNVFHLMISLLIPALFTILLTGCFDRDETMLPIRLGPEYPAEEVQAAIDTMADGNDPRNIQLGQFVHSAVINEIAGGAARGLASEIGETVIAREENAEKISILVVRKVVEYLENDKNRISSTETQYDIPKLTDLTARATPDQLWYIWLWRAIWNYIPAIEVRPATATATAPADLLKVSLARPAVVWPSGAETQLGAKMLSAAQLVTAANSPSKYHNLKTLTEVIPAPKPVQKRPNCGGLPGCTLRRNIVEFDQVKTENGETQRIHYKFAFSPDVPFFARNLDQCFTLMIPIGKGGVKTLLQQCTSVIDFRFDASAEPTS